MFGAGAPLRPLSQPPADGSRVFFESARSAGPTDTNGAEGCHTVGSPLQFYPACQDVYEWEARGTGLASSEAQNGGCLYLLSTGKSDEPLFFGDADESAYDAFIFTSE